MILYFILRTRWTRLSFISTRSPLSHCCHPGSGAYSASCLDRYSNILTCPVRVVWQEPCPKWLVNVLPHMGLSRVCILVFFMLLTKKIYIYLAALKRVHRKTRPQSSQAPGTGVTHWPDPLRCLLCSLCIWAENLS